MQTHLTSNGRNSNQEAMRLIGIQVTNDTTSVKKVFLHRSPARLNPVNLLLDSDNCVMQLNPHFDSVAELQAFVGAYPARLHTLTVNPISSGNLLEQSTNAIKILTPGFGKTNLEETIIPVPVAGGSSFLLPDFYLGSNTEIEITIQPLTKILITLQFGYYHSDRLVP